MGDQPDRVRARMGRDADDPSVSPPSGMLIGRVRGVPIYVSPLALLFALLIGSMLVRVNRDRLVVASETEIIIMAAVTSVGFLLSLLLHEIGHALTALAFHLHVRKVTLHGFAGFTEIHPEPQAPGREFLVALAGPLMNGILAVACYGGTRFVTEDSKIDFLLRDLGITNFALFVFNLAPGLPLDGGRLVVATVWGATRDKLRGLRVGSYGGFVVAAAVVAWGSLADLSGFGAVYSVLLGAFLAFGAYQSLRNAKVRARLPGLSAGRLARRTLPVEGAVPLAEALRRARETGCTAIAVVDREGTPVKIMNGSAVDALPEHRRPWMRVDEVSRALEPSMILDADLEGEALLDVVQKNPASEYLVVQNGRPAGVLAIVDLVARIDPAAAERMAGQQR
jgi:Zn-dependent protease/CBS domain-containing protein